MYLTVRNPWGQVSSLDLTNMPVFRLELAASRLPPDQPHPAPPTWLTISIRYVVSGTTASAIVAGLELKGTSGEAQQIAEIGLTRHDRAGNKDRVRESAKVLVNSMQQRQMEDANLKLGNLVDIYHDVLDAMWSPQRPNQLGSVGALAKGEFEGWQYLLTKTRFEPLLLPSVVQPGMASIGSFVPPIAAASVAVAPGTAGLQTPPPAPSLSMPPPPSSDSAPSSMPPAPGAPARRPSREQRRKSGEGAAAPAEDGKGDAPPADEETQKP